MDDHPANDAGLTAPKDSADLEHPTPADDGPSARAWSRGIPGALFAAIAVLIGADMVADRSSGASGIHLSLEAIVFLLALLGGLWLWGEFVLLRRRVGTLRQRLTVAHADAGRWRQEAQALLQGLGAAIDRQFEQWGLSPAEREVGLLLLKGLALRDIAEARGTSERTVRQQALTVYRKAQVAGRAELSAFFLEDLLLPREPGASSPKKSTS